MRTGAVCYYGQVAPVFGHLQKCDIRNVFFQIPVFMRLSFKKSTVLARVERKFSNYAANDFLLVKNNYVNLHQT